jgi:mannose-6-phosphate isomerase-like protein (cupin superfamily)
VDVRRVVTGHDKSGKSVFVSDEKVEPVILGALPGSEFHRLWGGDTTPKFPDDGSLPKHSSFFAPIGGFRFALFSVPPEGGRTAEGAGEADMAEVEDKLPGLLGYMEADDPGMHTTDTIDFEVVLSGSVTLELDDGAEVNLRQGDTVVQNGTRHRWKNTGTEPCVMAVFIVGAEHTAFPARHG